MSHFEYRADALYAENLPLAQIADEVGTPTYVYSRAALTKNFMAYADACREHGRGDTGALVCYSVKSNSNLAVLNLLGKLGSGFDIVSGGELMRVLAAGGDARKVIFSGVGKSKEEIKLALAHDILCFNVESVPELHRLSQIANDLGQRARVSLRVNPDVDPKTHPYISTGLKENKFGIAHQEALALYREAAQHPGLKVVGIDCHIGSQITDMPPFMAALEKLLELIEQLHSQGIALSHLDLGGGLGIRYTDEDPPSPAAFMQSMVDRIERHPQAREMELIFEFGRALVGNAGLLLTRLEYVKQNGDRLFAVVDAAMNDLIRPALYEGYHPIIEVHPASCEAKLYDVVGPVCESGDWLGKARSLRLGVEDDLLAILSAGAYGMAMSSNYNARPRAIELLVDGTNLRVIRERETIASLWQSEV